MHISSSTMADHDSGFSPERTNISDNSGDSTKHKKRFRRLVKRFAEKTSMQGVPYINNAKLWWAKLIWSVLLICAIGVMGLHLWYLFDQYYAYPKLTKVELGFANLDFPEITICNTNIVHKGRLDHYDGAEKLSELVNDLKPENLVPNQFDPNYDPEKSPDQQPAPNVGGSPTTPPNENNPQPPGPTEATQGPLPKPPGNEPLPPGKKRKKRFVENLDNLNRTKYTSSDKPPSPVLEADDYSGAITSQTEVEELFTSLYMDIGKKDRAFLGHNITDMLQYCSFNGRDCTASMFRLHQTSEYGNCWSISSNQFVARSSGPIGGLSLILYLETSEYLKGITTGYGARLLIHRKETYPTPADEGMFLPAAMETSIGLRMTTIERLGSPYGKCEKGDEFKDIFGYMYTRSACQQFCFLMTVIKKCNCFDNEAEEAALKSNSTLTACRTQDELICLNNISRLYTKKEIQCECPNPCSEVQWTKAVSQRQWPTDEYALVLIQSICDDHPAAVCKELRSNMDNKRTLSNNFLRLNIYYEELNYHNITETPEIEGPQFASDVGGAIGLWIGLSILSICELLQLFLELCDYGINRSVGREGQTRKERKRRRDNAKAHAQANAHLHNHPSDFRHDKSDPLHRHHHHGHVLDGKETDMEIDYMSHRKNADSLHSGGHSSHEPDAWPYTVFRHGNDHKSDFRHAHSHHLDADNLRRHVH